MSGEQYRPPEGYEKIELGTVDGWWKPEVGKAIRGTLLGLFYHGKNETLYFVLKLLDKAVGHTEGGPMQLGPGALLGVGERDGLRPLRDYAGSGKAEAVIVPTEKIDVPNSSPPRTLWRFELFTKGPRVPAKRPAGLPAPTSDEIPF